jgi:hypothetical protein
MRRFSLITTFMPGRPAGRCSWVFVTFFFPVLSTIYWLVIHWLESGVFWNALTLACASAVGLIVGGMICETLKQLIFR